MRLRVVATRITHPFSVTRTGAILLSQERNNSAVQTEDTLPPDTRRHPGATPTRSSFTPQWTLRHDNLALWGRKHWVKILQFSITNRLYTHIWKCHMGFCTPRRTVIDLKKKKKRHFRWVNLNLAISRVSNFITNHKNELSWMIFPWMDQN